MTIDEIYTGSRQLAIAPGGSSFYVANTARVLGATASIVSSIGSDYPVHILNWMRHRQVGLNRIVTGDAGTTRFQLSYEKNERKLRLLNRGARVPVEELVEPHDVVHLGPVFQEIDAETVRYARRHSSLLSLDVQGLLRTNGRSGNVRLKETGILPILHKCDVVKVAESEGQVLTRSRDPVAIAQRLAREGPKFAIVSLGMKGLVLASKRAYWRVPAYPERSLEDTTGAGDAMIAGWLVAFWRTNDPLWASAVGAAVSSMIIRHSGLAKFRISKHELVRRTAWVYERTRRYTI